ncbi:Signal transduction histidine kinase [Lachnospiraceae bacterium XBB1006]|nr:Signal transduction histidine kinase [Lachnospiraceae bacterium XBB1006]
MIQVYLGVVLVTLIVSGTAIFYMMGRDQTQEQRLLLFMLLLGFVHNLGLYLELNAGSVEGIMGATMVEYVGSAFYSIAFLMFAALHCNRKVRKEIIWGFYALSIMVIVAVWTNPFTNLYYSEFRGVEKPFFHVVVKYGPLQKLFLVAIIVPYAVAIYRLVYECKREEEVHRKRVLTGIGGMSFVPVISMFLYMIFGILPYDVTPIIMAWVVMASIFLLYKSNTFDVNRLASTRVLDIMDDGVITLDAERHILFANAAAKTIFPGLQTAKESTTISEIDDFPAEVMEGMGKNEFEKDGCLYEIHLNVVRDHYDAVRGYAILVVDETEMYGFFDELVSMKEKADNASKAKSEFLSSLSFEIRTPMNSIIGLCDMIMHEAKEPRDIELAKDLMTSSTGLMTIINNILDISKIETGRMELKEAQYRTDALMNDVNAMLKYMASEKGLSLAIETQPDMPRSFEGDVGKIRQVLINMVSNAIRYTDEGYVKLSLTYNAISDLRGELIFTISDSGTAVKEEEIPVFFENLGTDVIDKDGIDESTGLGLVIVKNDLELLGGTIFISIGDNGGVVTKITIPQRKAALEEEEAAMLGGSGKAKEDFVCPATRILIVDDNRINLKVAVGLMARYQMKIDEATSGKEAIEMVKETPYRIIFMDYMMPEMDGVETAKRIRKECGENGKNAIMVALSANAVKGAEEMFMENGFKEFLPKPVDKLRLHELLKTYIPEEEIHYVEAAEEDLSQVSKDDLSKLWMADVDVEDALRRKRHDVPDYLELLELFYTDGLEKVMLIREYAESQNYHDYEIEVHALKSAAANLGANSLSIEAKTHELATHDGEFEFVKEKYEVLLQHYEDVLSEVERVLRSYGKLVTQEEPSGVRPAITEEEVIRYVEDAVTFLEDFKPKDAMASVEALLGYDLEVETRKVLQSIKTKLKLYDDDAAEELLHELLDVLKI